MRAAFAGVATLVLAVTFSGAVAAAAQTHRYLYVLETKSGDVRYSGEIPTGTVIDGGYGDVDVDTTGRVTRVTWFWNGKTTDSRTYHYSTGTPFPDSRDDFNAGGVLTGTTRYTRDSSHQITRMEYYTSTGARTAYTVRTIGTEVESNSFSDDGQHTNRTIAYFSPAGLLIRSQWYPQDTIMYESEIDELTGETRSRQKVVGGHLVSSNKYTYDPYGDETRDDIYDSDGAWYGAREYSGNLETIERYAFKDGSTQEARFSYDENRWLTETAFRRNGQLVCTFKYDRSTDGAIKRTLAIGPDGTLLAEYPDIVVRNISQDGRPLDKPDVGKIYKQGSWW